jgi:hypothetical protein
MTQLLDLDVKLTILARNPCACDVCRKAANLAKLTLAEVAPSVAGMLDLEIDTPEFIAAEKIFRRDEAARLQAVYDIIGRSKCLMVVPPPATLTPIPELPDPEEWRERIEHYRKHAMKPRIEKMKNPRIPGSYIIK